jgi:hypothetical protein
MPDILYIILHHKTMRNYITHDTPIGPHKTRRQSPTPFSIHTFEHSGCEQKDGSGGQFKYSFIYSDFLQLCYLYEYQ